MCVDFLGKRDAVHFLHTDVHNGNICQERFVLKRVQQLLWTQKLLDLCVRAFRVRADHLRGIGTMQRFIVTDCDSEHGSFLPF